MSDAPTNGFWRDGCLVLSAHTLEMCACWRRGWYYKIAGRRSAAPSPGLVAGTAMHAALAACLRGYPVAQQEAAISAVLAKQPLPADDYRTAAYLQDGLAQWRAEDPLRGWRWEEIEEDGEVSLGTVVNASTVSGQPTVPVLWRFRRDAVGVAGDGRRYVLDFKTASRDESASYQAMRNSGQFMGYLWSWNAAHPDRPAVGVQPVRLILRPPSPKGTGVMYSFPADGAIYFGAERLEQWCRDVLAFAGELLRLDPSDPTAWRMSAMERGLCRHQWGVCEYLETCCLSTEAERRVHLDSPAYESAKRT